MPTMNYSYIYLSRYGRINFVVKLQRFVTERVKGEQVKPSFMPQPSMATGQEGSHFSEFSLTGEDLYIYCVLLPFTCNSRPNLPVALSGAAGNLVRVYQQLPQQIPHYSVVKVGVSKEPAQRLYSIMRAFEEFGAQDTQFHYLRENDSPLNTIEKGKREEKVIFITRCHDLGNAENKIRQTIGYDLRQNMEFQYRFTQTLDEDKQEYEKQVGKTEWVVIRTNLMKCIQEHYRRNWSVSAMLSSRLADCPTGEEFRAEIFSLCFQYEQNQQQGLPQDTVPYEVRIQFPPTNFSFSVYLQNPPRHMHTIMPNEDEEV